MRGNFQADHLKYPLSVAGHFMLAAEGTPVEELTKRNTTGGQLLVAFAILQILFFAAFWGVSSTIELAGGGCTG